MDKWAGDLTIGVGWVYYDGPVGHTEFHQHYAVQICFPSAGLLHIETTDESRSVETVLVIGSNVSHRLSTPATIAKILYVEPSLISQSARRLQVDGIEIPDLSPLQSQAIDNMFAAAQDSRGPDFGLELARVIWPAEASHAFLSIDNRIRKALKNIELSEDLNLNLDQIAMGSGLSASRFRHLFSAQVGMPIKSYLLWIKLQRALQSLAVDSSLTNAAHKAGFADSSHLSRTFKRTFGLAPADLNRNANITSRAR